ncbi:unnamed protein product [Rotaria sp. Silwood1]|nr:unnamed protein product [Rotaria sp. Silwood1]CAF1165036.1 unnamed protein product [Rotaria sp. Silwood1]
MFDLIETKHHEMFRRNHLTELGLGDNIDELKQRERPFKKAFIQKVKDKEAQLKETEKQEIILITHLYLFFL